MDDRQTYTLITTEMCVRSTLDPVQHHIVFSEQKPSPAWWMYRARVHLLAGLGLEGFQFPL